MSLWLGGGIRLAAQFVQKDEYDAKGQCLYVFATLTSRVADGAASTNSPFVLGILGSDPWNGGFPGALPKLKNVKSIKGRPVITKVFATADDVDKCDLLFIRSNEKKVLSRVLEVIKGGSILTVAESKDFAQMGGIVNLYVEERKDVGNAKFELNTDAAIKAGLKLELEFLDAAARTFPKRK